MAICLQPREFPTHPSCQRNMNLKNPFDLIYDVISKKVCRKNGKLQWDGSILSCQYGENPSGGDRPIPPATDISPNNPNAR